MDEPTDPAAKTYLRGLGAVDDASIDLAEAALHLALLRQPGADLGPSRALLARIVEAVAARPLTGLSQQVEALRDVIAGEYGFTGDRESYDDLQNASLIRVLDRRKGLPITLSIIYLHVARKLGWAAHGLAFPGHFLVALDGEGGRAVIDPFDACETRSTPELRALIKQMQGPAAELEPDHYASASNRQILNRLQNNMRARLVRQSEFAAALLSAEAVTWFSPHDAGAWRDMGMLHAEMGNLRAAVMTLEESLTCDTRPSRRHVTAALIQKLRTKLN